MKLIDADKLKKDVLDLRDCYNGFSDTYDKACIIGVIDEQPPAQPVWKRGKWEYHSNPNIRGGMNPEDAYCSVCGFHVCTSEVDDFDNYNYCPNCGADMREEREETGEGET